MDEMHVLAGSVWVIMRHGDDGHQQFWHAAISFEDAREVLVNLSDDDLRSHWWTIREHEIGPPVR